MLPSTPIAFDTLAITDLASCADTLQASTAVSAHATQIFLNMSSSSPEFPRSISHQRRALNHCGAFASGPGPTITSPSGSASMPCTPVTST